MLASDYDFGLDSSVAKFVKKYSHNQKHDASGLKILFLMDQAEEDMESHRRHKLEPQLTRAIRLPPHELRGPAWGCPFW